MKITIVGGGFGGVKAALELAEDDRNTITLISDKTEFQYYPALYGAATGHNHLESWVPLEKIFSGKSNVMLVQDTIVTIDAEAKELGAASGQNYSYETCILALGAVTTYFGIEGLDTYAYGIKSSEEIEKLKAHLYEEITGNSSEESKRYVVIGAGSTGVELSSALGSYIKKIYDHYGMNSQGVCIDLLEAAPRILPKMTEKASRLATKRLKKLGVNVQTGQAVEQATADSIIVGGKPLTTHTVIWTSGVTNHSFFKENKLFTLAKNGRVQVDEYLRASQDVYVIGDNADTPFTGLAQTALHDAIFVAGNLKRHAHGKPMKKYKAVKPPVVVPIGENWAIFEWHGFCMGGWIASILRRAADFIGYSDMLPLGQALGVWHASLISHDDNIMPEPPKK